MRREKGGPELIARPLAPSESGWARGGATQGQYPPATVPAPPRRVLFSRAGLIPTLDDYDVTLMRRFDDNEQAGLPGRQTVNPGIKGTYRKYVRICPRTCVAVPFSLCTEEPSSLLPEGTLSLLVILGCMAQSYL